MAAESEKNLRRLRYACAYSVIALIAVCLAGDMWFAPAGAEPWWPMLKALPLFLPLRGMLQGLRRTFQWSSFLSLAYFTEGVVRGWSESGLSQRLAWVEIILALIWFFCAIFAARALGPKRITKAA